MKKILLTLFILLTISAYAIQAPRKEDIYNELGITPIQYIKIQKIEARYQNEAKLIYDKMDSKRTPEENKMLRSRLYLLDSQKQNEIIQLLTPRQKEKLKEINSRVY